METRKYQEALEFLSENTKLTPHNINDMQWAVVELQELIDKYSLLQEQLMGSQLNLVMEIINEFEELNADIDVIDIRIVDHKTSIVNEIYKQDSEESIYFDDEVYVKQINPYEDYYHGTIAHRVKNSDYWVICDYTC